MADCGACHGAVFGTLTHWRYDTFRADWDDASIEPAYVTFALDADGKVARITMKAVSPLADFSYDYHDLLFTPVAADQGGRTRALPTREIRGGSGALPPHAPCRLKVWASRMRDVVDESLRAPASGRSVIPPKGK